MENPVSPSRFVVGIDLGTTNSALAYVDTGAGSGADTVVHHLPIPQVVRPGAVEDRALLPSFLYLPGPNELPAGSLRLPWAPDRDFAVGEFARNYGSQVPTRLVASAKSWLCHPGVDRRGQFCPGRPRTTRAAFRRWKPAPSTSSTCAKPGTRRSPGGVADNRLEAQDIILTVPASFDAVARELTVEAARAAGLEHVTLLEEPQAAFYAWLDASGEDWRKQVEIGDVILVCDVGGGTTDFTLIAVSEEAGNLALTRVAVGDHILLGGDNMDLALAHAAAAGFAAKGTKLDAGQMLMLWHSARAAKELLFTDPSLTSAPVTVLGRGSRVIGGTLKGELARADAERLLIDGFFPDCPPDDEPRRQKAVGLQELGLPYASDPAITKHLAAFLHRQAEVLAQHAPPRKRRRAGGVSPPVKAGPTALLFNGGVFKAEPLRERVATVLNTWAKTTGRPRGQGAARRRSRPGGGAGRRLLRPGPPRPGHPHPRRHRPGILCRHRVVVARRPRRLAAAQGAVRCPLRHGGRDRGRRAGPGVRPGGRHRGRVPLPRLHRPPYRCGRHAGRGVGRADRGDEPDDGHAWRRRGRPARRCRCTCTAR